MAVARVAALFVEKNGPYAQVENCDLWDKERDARNYAGPWPVIAHPPCERWGRYWSGGPSARVRRALGDDGGCFEAALYAVRRWGGAIEHPEASHAWSWFRLPKPNRGGGWMQHVCDEMPGTRLLVNGLRAWTCCVEQGHYGHAARKATWLYYVGHVQPPELVWGASQGRRIDEGFHSNEERLVARAVGHKPLKRLSKSERILTPPAFRDLLVGIARGCYL